MHDKFCKAIMFLISVTLCSMGQDMNVVPPNLIFELLALNRDLETKQKPKYLTPSEIIVSKDSTKLYVAEQTAKQVVEVTLSSGAVIKTMSMPNEPTGMALSPDGTTLYVTCSSDQWPSGMVCFVSTASGKIMKSVAVGHSARSPVTGNDGKTLYVCNLFEDNVSVIDVASATEILPRIKVTREPYAAKITPDGATLVVTNALPDGKATADMSQTNPIACKVSLVNTATKAVTSVPLPPGAHSLFGVCITSDGKYAFVTHLADKTTFPITQIDNGWVRRNNIAVIDLTNKKRINDVALDPSSSRGMGNPWGMAITPDNKFLCVAFAGVNTMTMIDLPQFVTLVTTTVNATSDSLGQEFYELASIRKDIPLTVIGPRALAIAGAKAYVAGYFSDNLNVVDVSSLSATTPLAILPLPTAPKTITPERQGEINFYDATLCLDQWQSCSSCHPFTRPDALNWILKDAITYPKNTKSMLYSWWTPPMRWLGTRPGGGGATGSVVMSMKNELFADNTPAAVALDSFLLRIKPLPSPYLVKGRLSDEAKRGKLVYNSFTKGECVTCHPAPLYTDMRPYNVGVPDPPELGANFDTPSLVETWRTSPYGHLGSFDTLANIIMVPGHSAGVHTITTQELSDLLKYVLSL
jgi:YVTN family beta-propeller protein